MLLRSPSLVLCTLLAAGCGATSSPEPSQTGDAGTTGAGDAALAEDASPDAEASAEAGAREDGSVASGGEPDANLAVDPRCGFQTHKVDLLFVVDNSRSMREEQALLAAQLPEMTRALASGDLDNDGELDYPKADLHVGVVSTDMGLSGQWASGTGCTRLGDDGVLRTLTSCERSPLGYLAYTPESGADAAEFGVSLGCQIQLGTEGCGFEQQLEAMLKALTPSSSELGFALGTKGHGDGPNAGFVRNDSVLAVVLVTDEDDCSFPETSVGFPDLTPTSPYAAFGYNYRCQAKPELLYPVSRYVESLPKLRENLPGSVVFAVIGGIPTDIADGTHSIAQILSDERMAFVPNGTIESNTTTPVPACGSATPARRLLETAQAFGDHAVVGSICEETFERPVAAIAKLIGGVLACPAEPVIF